MIAALLLSLPPSLGSADPQPPPGMVFIKGEPRVKVGLDAGVAKELVGQTNIVEIWGETPEHSVKVDDFFLMLTEVTNEQFAEYVGATQTKPPQLWAADAIEEGRKAYVEDYEAKRKAAVESGKKPPEVVPFDRTSWWASNWRDKPWKVPKGAEGLPVVQIDHVQAEGYARWAGLRLMTEEEYTRAVRGKTSNLYPWGETFESSKAVTQEAGLRDIQPVGTRPAGASVEGVLDLAGNVWEWTSSKYVQFPGHKTDKISVKGRSLQLVVNKWDDNMRVTVGGCVANDSVAARVTTRRGATRTSATEFLGFRCAGSPRIGEDIAQIVLKDDIKSWVRSDHDFDLTLTIATDRWQYISGEAPKRYSTSDTNPLANYAVITNYDYLMFVPVAEIKDGGVRELSSTSVREAPVVMGFLSTTVPLMEPELGPGTYVVAWRGTGKSRPPKPEGEEEEGGEKSPPPPTIEEQLGFDPDVEHFIFMTGDGEPLLALPSKNMSNDRLREGRLEVKQVPADERGGVVAHDLLTVSAAVPTGRSKAFLFDLPLKFAPGSFGGEWRRR